MLRTADRKDTLSYIKCGAVWVEGWTLLLLFRACFLETPASSLAALSASQYFKLNSKHGYARREMQFSMARSKRLTLQLQLCVVYFQKKNGIVFSQKFKSYFDEISIIYWLWQSLVIYLTGWKYFTVVRQSCVPTWLIGLRWQFGS